jgi:menaquinol-cytochrome c reductase iron-sulfur subunit
MPEGSFQPAPGPDRREFLVGAAGWVVAAGALLFSVAGIVRFLIPNVHYAPSPRIRIPLNRYPEGVTYLARYRLFLVRRGRSFRALSGVCTHLGCSVAQAASGKGFHCPCHGSRFDEEGRAVEGPARRPLPWLAVEQAADGSLVIDRSRMVSQHEVLTI